MTVQNILETSLYVDDLPRAEQFYRDVLGFTLVGSQTQRHVFFRCGRQMLLLFNPLVSREPDEQFPPHGAFGPGHVAFGVAEHSLERWSARLAERGVAIERVLDWPQGGRSLYFRDPAGNLVELTTPRIWGLGEETLSSS
jgi:catechol 2,3-dioxygenase-like lactoylglutathione lyase family enzyme